MTEKRFLELVQLADWLAEGDAWASKMAKMESIGMVWG
jgi:hypothetical protein